VEKVTRRKCALLLAAFIGAASAAAAPSPRERFDQAKAAYDRGDFTAARELYEGLSSEGYGGPALDYDLGNVYERLGRPGRARLWYERALEESPLDEDARHNRDLVMQRLGLKEEAASPLAPWEGALAWAFAGLNFLFFGILAAGLFRQEEALWWAKWGAGLALAAAAALYIPAREEARQPWAVVTAPRAEARSAPSADAAVGFVAPEGQKVALLQTAGDWCEIGLPSQSLKGWIPRADAEDVNLPDQRRT
jgi:tetratricopeptide (TPR) repeat protein